MFARLKSKIKCKKYGADSQSEFREGAVSINSVWGGHNLVCENAKIVNSTIGYGTHVAKNSEISHCRIGKYCAVGFVASLGAHPIHNVASIHPALYSTLGQYGFTYVKENTFAEFKFVDEENKICIDIGNDVWVTAGSTKIHQGITIGDGAVVMQDAVVTKDVPPYAIVAGIPAKIIGYRFSEEDIDFLLKLKWWDKPEEWIIDHAMDFRDISVLRARVEKEGLN